MRDDDHINLTEDVNTKNSAGRMFEFPGSHYHEIPVLPYTIEEISLKIFPDFQKVMLAECTQNLNIKFQSNTKTIELDIAELKILSVTSHDIVISGFSLKNNNEKLRIDFAEAVQPGTNANISIHYSAGYYKRDKGDRVMCFGAPRNGFHFVQRKKTNDNLENNVAEEERELIAYQAWTQGEATEAKYWFPCIDSPHVKFRLNIEITAPAEFEVISNGKLISKVPSDNNNNQYLTWKFVETNPLPAYLVSVVIGKFSKIEISHNTVSLGYYWPEDIQKDNAMLTFSETPRMIGFFEKYFDTKYPFHKYTQVAVDNFEFGGMENLSCTTFTRRVLHDEKTSLDYKNDILLIAHELAHQWFGDLVTCKGWPHIWLNEGFATYCESLYLENSKGIDEFHYSLIEATDIYFEEANEYYVRPIVTNVYKHPDELFDAHAYEKAGFILHMIRCLVGETNFQKSIKQYLSRFQNSTATTSDLIQTIEGVSGVQLQTFFDQWIYRKGHPEIEIEYSLVHASINNNNNNKVKKLKIKVNQSQNQSGSQTFLPPYQFELEIKIVVQDTLGRRKEIFHSMKVSQMSTESVVEFADTYSISYISIDPQFKILKVIKSVKIQDEVKEFQLKRMLVNQLKSGDTIIEKIQAIRIMKNFFHDDFLNSLRDVIENDKFYGVGKEAADTIGSYQDKNNFEKSDKAYQTLLAIITNSEKFQKLNNHVKRALLKNIGLFERTESVDFLESFLKDPTTDSDFIKSVSASSLGKSCRKASSQEKRRSIKILKEIIDTSESFQSIAATGALEGLYDLSNDNDLENIKQIYLEVAKYLLENTNSSKDYFIRAKATRLLGKFLANKFDVKDSEIVEINQKVFNRLRDLLRDERRKIKMNACEALSDKDARFATLPDKRIYESIRLLIEVAKEDLDGFVRRKAETSANRIREWIHSWSSSPLSIDK